MATSEGMGKEEAKEHLVMKTPPIVSQQEWEAAGQQMLVKERARCEIATPWPLNAGFRL